MSSQNFKLIWDEALNKIQQEYIEADKLSEYNVWFTRIQYIEDTGTELTVSFPSNFLYKIMISNGYIQKIQDKIKDLTDIEVSINPLFNKETQKTEISENNLKKLESEQNSVPINDNTSVPESDTIKPEKTIPESLIPEVLKTEEAQNILNGPKKHSQLREEYTFERYVVGENNEFAYCASLAAAREPGKKFNPLLIYGGTGLGKTHLMQSIGNYILNNPPEDKEEIKLCCLSAENLLNDYTSSLKNKTVDKFNSKYRNLDVLLLDDIHFLINKPGLQEEVFYIFEALFHRKAQMVFTCDRPLSELNGIEDRLKSRFSLGTPTDLQPPNYETRIAIIQKKLELSQKTAPAEVIDYIAKNIHSNVRELEGCLNKLIGYAELLERPLTLDIAKKQLSSIINNIQDESITIDTILKVVCNYYNITIADIKGSKRNPKFSTPRHIAVYLSRKLADRTFTEIAGELGGRDHTTIMNSNKKIEALLQTDEDLNVTLEVLKKKIKEYRKI